MYLFILRTVVGNISVFQLDSKSLASSLDQIPCVILYTTRDPCAAVLWK